MQTIKDSIKTIITSLLTLSLISVAYAWTEPTTTPPTGNVNPPITTSSDLQTKTGWFTADNIETYGQTSLATVTGNVGIGIPSTQDPASKLEVKSTVDEILRLTRDGGTYPTIFKQGADDALVVNNNNEDVLTINNGNVGIRITNSGGNLEVAVVGEMYTKDGFTCDAGDTAIEYKTSSNWCSVVSQCSCNTGGHDWSSTGNYQETCTFYKNKTFGSGCYNSSTCYAKASVKCKKSSASTRFKVDDSGIYAKNVGILTLPSSTSALTIAGDTMISVGRKIGSSIADITFGRIIGGIYSGETTIKAYDTADSMADDIIFNTGNMERMRIKENGLISIGSMNIANDGNIGIGTGSPQSKLHISGDLRVDGSTTGVDSTPLLKGYWQLNINGTNYAIPLYNAVSDWVNKVTIEYAQNNPDNYWATEQSKSWKADGTIDSIRVSGSSDDGGYCYAWWGGTKPGHVERYRHDGRGGLYNDDGKWYSSGGGDGIDNPCPTYPPSFDNGSVKICQNTSSSGGFSYGNGSAGPGLGIASGTTIYVKARHTIGRSSDYIKCYMDVRYKK